MNIYVPGTNKNTKKALLHIIICLLIWVATCDSTLAAPKLNETVLTANLMEQPPVLSMAEVPH